MTDRLVAGFERVLARCVGPDVARTVAGDLEEALAERARRGGVGVHHRLWLLYEMAGCFSPRVLRALRGGPDPTRRRPVHTLISDLRHALRGIRRAPGFSALATLTLGLGVGAATVVASAVDGFVLNPFPFPEGHTLVGVGSAYPKLGAELSFVEHLAPAEYQDIGGARSLRHVVAWDMGNRQVAFGEATENLFSAFWWGDAFPTLGVAPHLGRGFAPDEVAKGSRVAVLSYRVWRDRFGADSGIVGKAALVNGDPYTVIGVMPPRTLLYGTDLWLPMSVGPEVFPRNRRQFQVLGKLCKRVDEGLIFQDRSPSPT